MTFKLWIVLLLITEHSPLLVHANFMVIILYNVFFIWNLSLSFHVSHYFASYYLKHQMIILERLLPRMDSWRYIYIFKTYIWHMRVRFILILFVVFCNSEGSLILLLCFLLLSNKTFLSMWFFFGIFDCSQSCILFWNDG